jgi:hypothetical protein
VNPAERRSDNVHYLAPRASFRQAPVSSRQYKRRFLSRWMEDVLGATLLFLFVWLCIGPGLDLMFALMGWK